MYKLVQRVRFSGNRNKAAARQHTVDMVDRDHEAGLEALKKQTGKKQKSLQKWSKGRPKSHSWMPSDKSSLFQTAANSTTKTPKSFQMKLTADSPNPELALALDHAISDVIHCNGLSFTLSEDPKFRKMIKLAKGVSSTYVTPSRKQISGPLLKNNYDRVMEQQDKDLLRDAEMYGLMAFGDAATIKRTPFINLLASSPSNPAACLEVHDCTEHLENGGTKDAEYIAELFMDHMKRLDPDGEFFDQVTFDGGSNFQKAARALQEVFPRCEVTQGAEHVLSLMFKDILHCTFVHDVMKFYQILFRWFGGSHHQIYATWKKYSRMHNKGRAVALLRPSDVRMAGYIYAFLRLLGCRKTIESMIASPEYPGLKVDPRITNVLKCDTFWKFLILLVKASFGPLWLLRLADSKEPVSDKIFYYVRKTDEYIEKYKNELNQFDEMESDESRMLSVLLQECFVSKRSLRQSNHLTDEDIDACTNLTTVDGEEFYAPDDDDDPMDFGDDNDDDDDSEERANHIPLGDLFERAWYHRRKALVSDYAIGAWFCSPVPEIKADVKQAMTESVYSELVERAERSVVRVLLPAGSLPAPDYQVERTRLLTTFATELRDFQDETGAYARRDHIWQAPEIEQNKSYLWHRSYSHGTKVLYRYGPRATSKVVGIGSAERKWGNVKHVKKDKRSHLSSEVVKMQATLNGLYCSEKASIQKQYRLQSKNLIVDFMDEDFLAAGLGRWGIDVKAPEYNKPTRVFNCWKEDWEKTALKEDVVVRNRFLKKYGNICWLDCDGGNIVLRADDRDMHFSNVRGKDRGYNVIALTTKYDPENPDPAETEPWMINHQLFGQIYEYYKANPDPSIFVCTKPESFLDDGVTWNFEYDGTEGPPAKKTKKRKRP